MADQANRLTVSTSFAVMKLIEANIATSDGGMCEYAPGWSDERIAKEVGVATSTVQHRRKELYGDLKRPTAVGTAEILRRLEAIERRLDQMDASVAPSLLDFSKLGRATNGGK